MDYELVKRLIRANKSTVKKVAEAIGMTEPGLYKAFKNDSLTVNKLENIAKVIGIPVIQFFIEDTEQLDSEKTDDITEIMKRLESIEQQINKGKDSKG